MGDAAERVEQLRAEAARIPPEPDVVDLARTSPAMIARNLEMLWETLAGDPKEAGEARDALAVLIDRIRFIPGENRGAWNLQIVGDLAALLDLAPGGPSKKALVAGAGFEPATFRL